MTPDIAAQVLQLQQALFTGMRVALVIVPVAAVASVALFSMLRGSR